MRYKLLATVLLIVLLPLGPSSAQTERPELRLSLVRTFGYQAGNRIQGSFSLRVSGVDDLVQVDYLLDGSVLATVSQAPFRASFSTGSYSPGAHSLRALATRSSGDQLESQMVNVFFITAEQSWQNAGRIAAWVLAGVLLVMLVGVFGTGWLTRGKGRFALGVYGSAGGAVCRRCGLPFGRHALAPNLLVGKLERCPHCGRVAIVARAGRDALDAAEARYREDQQRGQRAVQREGEDYRQRLDDSRFEG